MFWGLIIKPRKTYSTTVVRAFRVTHAVLDVSSANNNSDNKLMVKVGPLNQEYILCILNKSGAVQVQLDLNFSVGDTISFYSIGTGTVHLTGYLIDNCLNMSNVEDASNINFDVGDDVSGVYDCDGLKLK